MTQKGETALLPSPNSRGFLRRSDAMKTALRIAAILFALILFITGCSADHKQPIEDLQTSAPTASAGEGEQLEVIATEPKDETPSEKPSEPSESTEKTEAPTKPTEEVEPSEATRGITGATEKPTQTTTTKPTTTSSSGSQPEPTEPPATSSTAKPPTEPTEKTEAPTEPTEPPKVVYDIDAAMAAGNAYALQIGFGSIEYSFDPAAGNCGYYPCAIVSGDLITSRGGQSALNQLATGKMDSLKEQLVAWYEYNPEEGYTTEEILSQYRVRSYITYDEAADKYKIYDLYG